PWPSGVRNMTMSTWTLSSPLTRSTHGPSTGISPSIVMPSAVKKATAAGRSSTTTLTWSNLLIVTSPSVRRSLHELADLFLDGGSEPLQGEGGWPDVTVVEVCSVLETECRVSRLELLPALEEADNLAVLRIRGHPVPGFRRQGRRAGFDDAMEPLGHAAIRFRHLRDLREHLAFPVHLTRERAPSLFQ